MSNFIVRYFQKTADRLHSDRAAAAISFILTFPIFLWIVAIMVQYALIVNAKVLVDFAAQEAARAAVTSLPEGNPDNVTIAACMALEPLSPKGTGDDAQADDIYNALYKVGEPVGDAVGTPFRLRYTYAMNATTVSWNPGIDFTTAPGTTTDVQVVYNFRLTVPGAMTLVGATETIDGITGRFLQIASTCRVQTSHSRKAASDGNGWPQ